MQRTTGTPTVCSLCDRPESKQYTPGRNVISFICSRCTIRLPNISIDSLIRQKHLAQANGMDDRVDTLRGLIKSNTPYKRTR